MKSEENDYLLGQVESAENEIRFSGSFGFVIKPDSETQRKAAVCSRELFPEAEYLTNTPHITLFHGKVENLPEREVRTILKELRKFNGEKMRLNKIDIFGGKFAFWNNETTQTLQSMHESALEMSKYIDRGAVQRAVEEGLSMSDKELDNIRKYGHPLVGDYYKPHITLAYDSKGLVIPEDSLSRSWDMSIDDVLFTEMGKYGSVARVIEE